MNLGALLDLGVDQGALRDALGRLDLAGYALRIGTDSRQGMGGVTSRCGCAGTAILSSSRWPRSSASACWTRRERSHNALATRADAALFEFFADLHPEPRYNALGRTIVLAREGTGPAKGRIAIVTAGTAALLGTQIELLSRNAQEGVTRSLPPLEKGGD